MAPKPPLSTTGPSPLLMRMRQRANALARYRDPDDPVRIAANLDSELAKLEAHVARVVATFHPLPDEQVQRVAAMLKAGAQTKESERVATMLKAGSSQPVEVLRD